MAHFYYVSSESGSFGLAEVRLTEPNNVKDGKFSGSPKVTLTELAQLPSPSRVAIAQVRQTEVQALDVSCHCLFCSLIQPLLVAGICASSNPSTCPASYHRRGLK